MSPSAEHNLRNGATSKQLGGGEEIEITFSVPQLGQLLTSTCNRSTYKCMHHHKPTMTSSLQSFNLQLKYLGVSYLQGEQGRREDVREAYVLAGGIKRGPKIKTKIRPQFTSPGDWKSWSNHLIFG